MALEKPGAFREGTYHVVLLDLRMPGMNGIEVARAIRAEGWKGPVVALTANAMSKDREACMAAGSDDFASKPLRSEDLRRLVARHARRDAA